MASLPHQLQVYTFDESLELEEQADFKSEFHNGAVYATSGGTPNRARLSVRMSGMPDRLLYPDAMALCGEPQFWTNRKGAILNPTIIVEVLSPSTEKFDKQTKAAYYRALTSVQHILLVAQDSRLIDHFSRQTASQWTVTRYQNGTIPLAGTQLNLDEIYANIL